MRTTTKADEQYVSVYAINVNRVPVITDAMCFQPHGRWAFVQKWLWKALNKMRALQSYISETDVVRRYDINKDSFMEKLSESYCYSFPRGRPQIVYIGPDEFEQLVGAEYDWENYGRLQFNTRYTEGRGSQWQFMDLPVEVVPHMKGVLIL